MKAIEGKELATILELLRDSDLSMPEIAERMGLGVTVIHSINEKQKIRDYHGHRTQWKMS